MDEKLVQYSPPQNRYIQLDIVFAEKYGVNEALFFAKLYRLQDRFQGHTDEQGNKWVRMTLEEWETELPFWDKRTIRRIIKGLEDNGLIFSTTFKGRSKWYRLNPRYVSGQSVQSQVDNLSSTSGQSVHLPISFPREDNILSQNGKKQEPSSPGKKPNPKDTSYAMFVALCELCKLDEDLISNGQRNGVFKFGKHLREKKDATEKDIENFGRWWYANDWRGKQGQPPTIKIIRQVWGQFVNGSKVDFASKQYSGQRISL